jgi:uncharacterized OB-fold protein
VTTTVPAIEGWFTTGDEPCLLGLRDPATNTYFFPRDPAVSRPPQAGDVELEDVELSRTGTLWSYVTNHYQPPDPYVSPDPFVPYTVAAVELAEEAMVVLGQLAVDVDPADLSVGMEMEVIVETLFTEDGTDNLIWKWRPTGAEGAAS